MILIVGLGNPGEKYKNNRHNVGFQFIDYIAPLLHCSVVRKDKLYTTMKQFNNETIVLAKPQTFMNLSGQAVKQLIKNLSRVKSRDFKLKIKNLIVAHDDLDIPIGKFKIQKGIGPKLHNGIESIEKELGTKDFWRVRIGVDNRKPETWIDGEPYVLQDFTTEEKKIILATFPNIMQRVKTELT